MNTKKITLEILNKIVEIEIHTYNPSLDSTLRAISNKVNSLFDGSKYKILKIK